ncbi:MAG TPA: hypothetical protein VK468_00250, partial [Pyrinomonadaceae bacterium]|nr:hypothetical protein [Pyrinomonadaceae bacterium]
HAQSPATSTSINQFKTRDNPKHYHENPAITHPIIHYQLRLMAIEMTRSKKVVRSGFVAIGS